MWREADIASFQCSTKIIFGIGAHQQLADFVRERASKRLLVLLDPGLADSAIYRKVASILAQSDVATAVFNLSDPSDSLVKTAPESQPTDSAGRLFAVGDDSTVMAVLQSRRQHGADGLLAIGGESTIDVAKAAGRLMPSLPLIAMPTTIGTRSVVSGEYEIAILDPLTVGSMSAHDAAYAGIDAFVHAFESYLSKRATVFSDAVNLHAMTLIAGSIRAFVADRNNQSAALDVLCGSSLAAMSFGATGLGNVNCMATSVAALAPVPRGLANAICLPHAAGFNVSANPERYARIATILGIESTGRSEAQGGAQAIHGLRALCSDLGIPPRLRDVGVSEDQLDELARRSVAADYSGDTTEQDFRTLFGAAF